MKKIDIAKWLKEDMGFTDAEVADLVPKFTPERVTKLESGYVNADTLATAQAEIADARAKLQTANDNLNAELAEWGKSQARDGQITQQMRDDLDAAKLKVTQLTSRVTRIATDAGLDPAKALEGIEQAAKKEEPTVPPVDLTGYLKQGDLSGVVNMALTLPAELQSIADEHFELTGKRLDTRTIIREIQTRAKVPAATRKSLDPREVWEETNKIADLRAARDQQIHDDEIKAAEERGRLAAQSEMATPGSTPPAGRHAPAFRIGSDGKPPASHVQRPQPMSGTMSAVTALRSGKYRTATK